VSARRYTLRARAEATNATRDRILNAARALLVEGDFRRVTVDQIAATADVARATVYHQFGSKVGVFEALVINLEQRAGLERLVAVIETEPPATLVRAVIAAGCRYWATDPDLVRTATALARLQPDLERVVAPHDAGRLRLLSRMVDRLSESGVLRPGCPPRQAVDHLWLLTSFDAYDMLSQGRELSQDEVAQRLAELAEAVIAA
jgi:AcrR family transcriptional regulator